MSETSDIHTPPVEALLENVVGDQFLRPEDRQVTLELVVDHLLKLHELEWPVGAHGLVGTLCGVYLDEAAKVIFCGAPVDWDELLEPDGEGIT